MSEKENLHKGHRQRMWKKYLEHGIDCFADHEILEMLLYSCYTRRNTNDIAHELIKRFGSLEGVINASYNELCEVENVGPSAAATISFMNDFAKRFHTEDYSGLVLADTESLRAYCTKLLTGCKIEVSHALYLDSRFALITQQRLSRGHTSAVEFDIRTIAERALKFKCSNVVLVHNHPGGVALPSSTDVSTTRRVSNALYNLGIKVVDHIIVVDGDSYSMRRARLLQDIW